MQKWHDAYTTETAKFNSMVEKHSNAHRAYKNYAECKESSKQSDTRMRHTQNQCICVKYAVVQVVQRESHARLKQDTLQKHNCSILIIAYVLTV